MASFMRYKWKPPGEDFVKINFDGSYDRGSFSGGIGIVARNANGDVLDAKAARILEVDDPFLVEAQAAVAALEFAADCGFRRIILEGDALCIIKRLQGCNEDRSLIGNQIEEGRSRISNFHHCKLLHCSRECNGAAHGLAKFGLHNSSDSIWMEDYPERIHDAIETDMFYLTDE
ncbi:hypothetical protein PTKIN_Ptkin09bG0260100 [Pterospermum kingtungense]